VQAYHAHEIANRVVPETSAGWFTGQRTADVWRVPQGPWIAGMAETLQALTATGSSVWYSRAVLVPPP
jgi:hypothetical protein